MDTHKPTSEFTRWASALFLIIVAFQLANAADPAKPGDNWIEPFNGRDLIDWDGAPSFWRVEGGVLVGETTPEHKVDHHSYLIWRGGEVRDFELRVKFRIAGKSANSGVQYRSKDLGNHEVAGYQCNIEPSRVGFTAVLEEMKDREGKRRHGHLAEVGEVVRFAANGERKVAGTTGKPAEVNAGLMKDDWNDLTILADGPRLRHWLNGKLVVDVTDEDAHLSARNGLLALQLHLGPPMKVEFKDMRLRSIGAATTTNAGGAATFTEPKVVTFTAQGKPATQTVYRTAEFRGLEIRMMQGETRSLGKDKADNAFVRAHEKGALEFIGRDTQMGERPEDRDRLPLLVCAALRGYPAIITGNDLFAPSVIRFELSKPARVYAWIDAENSVLRQPAGEAARWQRFLVEPQSRHTLYFRDFAAGANELRLGPGHFCGAGVCPLDSLSNAEKIIATADGASTPPMLRVRNEHADSQKISISYAWRDPAQSAAAPVTEKELTLQPGMNEFALPAGVVSDGIVYWLDATLSSADATWKVTAPHGHLPALPADASVQQPIVPYGAYLKLECNDDDAVLGTLLRATFHQLRKLHMNTVVLMRTDSPASQLDLVREYGMKAVVRLHRIGGAEQESMMKHPAVLTYMIGDEPKIGPKLDAHIAMFAEVTKKYPQFKPVTCTIFDDWGTGSEADPDRIYNDHLTGFDLIRLGRLYSFQKLDYGVGKPISYKPRLDATSIFLGIEADAKRDWWLVPAFFGQPAGAPAAAQYWRTPTGFEMANFMHLALSHRCTGILGWGTHSHQSGIVQGMLFDGRTMQVANKETFAAMQVFGEQFTRIKPVLRAFTPALIPVHRTRPFALDVQARWLKTGQMAVYAVNRDLENEANTDLLVLIADRLVAKYKKQEIQPQAFVAEIDSVKDAFTGNAADWKTETQHNRFDYLHLTDKLAPGEARLYLVSGKDQGRFSEKAVPPGAREQFYDKDFAPID